MSELIKIVTNKLIDDSDFMKSIEDKLKEITKDGKINKNDIPHIMVIIVKCTNNLKSFNLSYNELFEILEEVVLFILNHFKVISESELNDIKPMIHSCVELTMLQPNVQNCLSSTWIKIKHLFTPYLR